MPSSTNPSATILLPLTSKIQWPFGYGLSYTTFAYENLQVKNEAQTTDAFVELTFQVKNTGEVAADEVAQLYLSSTAENQQIRPIQLQGFARVSLKPGESKTVKVKLYTEQFGFYTHENGVRQWNINPGDYLLKVGASSADIRLEQKITLKGEPQHKPLRDFYFSEASVE